MLSQVPGTYRPGRRLWADFYYLTGWTTGAAILYRWSNRAEFVLPDLILIADIIAYVTALANLEDWLIFEAGLRLITLVESFGRILNVRSAFLSVQ